MILFLAALFALAAAAAIAVAIQYDSGYVLLAYGHTTVEMTLWVALALLALFLFMVWLLFSLLRRSARLSDKLGALRGQRRQQRERQRSHRGVIAYTQGNWLQAKRLLLSSASSDKPLINYLLAARACQRLGDERGALQALSQAKNCGTQAGLAAALTQAELQLDN
ncbi:MAG: heme biosynthesis HemY N-terminal domain-containing protein, partial [Pseudomonadota bacterium]|nr:heme biosynthesis HemY N-terminal domain-containing protein [Pseudomonadota bacterium]